MRGAIYHAPHDATMEDLPDKKAGPDDVLVKIAFAGICGSDVTAWTYDGAAAAIYPNCEFGHEMSGTIVEVGENVKDIAIGDRVWVNPTTARPGGKALADTTGGFSEYVLVEQAKVDYNIYKLPDNVTLEEAALIEPFCVGTHGKNVPGVKKGDHVVIYGAGTIGLCCLSSLVGMGMDDVVIVDVVDERLELAKEMGGVPFNSAKEGRVKDFLKQHFGTRKNEWGYDVPDIGFVIDCAGAKAVLDDFMNYGDHATFSVLAIQKRPYELNFSNILAREVNFLACNGYDHEDIVEVIDNLANHRTKIDKIITHHFPHEKLFEALDTASDMSTGAIKVLIDYSMDAA